MFRVQNQQESVSFESEINNLCACMLLFLPHAVPCWLLGWRKGESRVQGGSRRQRFQNGRGSSSIWQQQGGRFRPPICVAACLLSTSPAAS